MIFFGKNDKVANAVKKTHEDEYKRILMLIVGVFFNAMAFNIFFLPKNIVIGGVSGIGQIFNNLFNVDINIFIALCSAVLLIVSYIVLGKKSFRNAIVGSLLYVLFVYLTKDFNSMLGINLDNILLVIVFGGLLLGLSFGLIYKSGYSSGGTDIPEEMLYKFAKISRGKASLYVDGAIVLIAGFFVGDGNYYAWEQVMYAIMILYLSSIVTDKVMLGISESKCFYIVTTHETSVKRYLMTYLKHGVTILDGRGGYTGDHKKILMCIIPTKEYFLVKDGIHNIDPDAFFLVTDAYEVYGGE